MQGQVCAGCDHAHLDGRDKPCACGCGGFIVSLARFHIDGCENPDCPDCMADGKHPRGSTGEPR